MYRIKPFLLWAAPGVLLAIALAYSFYRRSELGFWDGAVGNWLATLLGIVTGVPVALAMERRRAEVQRVSEERSSQLIKGNVLRLLMDELGDVRAKIVERRKSIENIPIEPLHSSAWDAMRAAGNLRLIAEPPLIGPISEAYRLIHLISETEHLLLRIIYGVNVNFPDGENAAQKVLRNVQAFHTPALLAINRALTVVEQELKTGESPCVDA